MSDAEYDREVHYSTSVPVAPDGGWGWVVCVASFLSFVILDGAMFTYGIFYVELLDYFGQGKGLTAIVGSIFMGMSMLFGSFTSVMINLWGMRKVAICGSLLAALSIGCSIFSPNVQTLAFIFGFLGGAGVAMVYVPSIVVVGFYFDKRRALANGITSSGSGLGVFIFSPLFNYLIDVYTWKGAMLILSGVILHCVALSALYRPLTFRLHTDVEGHRNDSECRPMIDGNCPQKSVHEGNHNKILLDDQHKARSAVDINALPQEDLLRSLQIKRQGVLNTAIDHDHQGKLSAVDSSMHNSLSFIVQTQDSPKMYNSWSNLGTGGSKLKLPLQNQISLKPLEKKDIFYSGSLHRLSDNPQTLQSMRDSSQIETTVLSSDKEKSFTETLKNISGVHLLKEPLFLFIIAYSVLWTTHSSILTILPHYCIERGHSDLRAATLLSIIGIANTLGRLLAGWISNFKCVNCMWVNIVALFVGGVTCFLIPYTEMYALLCIEVAAFGTGMATWTSLRPIILVDLLGISNLTSAFGMLAMFQGVAFIVGPPVAGFLYDYLGSYQIPFILAGTAFTLSGILCIVISCLFSPKTRK